MLRIAVCTFALLVPVLVFGQGTYGRRTRGANSTAGAGGYNGPAVTFEGNLKALTKKELRIDVEYLQFDGRVQGEVFAALLGEVSLPNLPRPTVRKSVRTVGEVLAQRCGWQLPALRVLGDLSAHQERSIWFLNE